MITKLYDYQEKTAEDIFQRIADNELNGAYIAFETGVGKSLTAISVGDRLLNKNWIDGVVVICPVSKIDDWERDLKQELPDLDFAFVTSFQSAWRTKNSKIIEDRISQCPALLIIDEGHKMKTYDSKQSKFIQDIAIKYKPYILILSATPQNKKYIDLYPQYKALGSTIFNQTAKDFKKEFCIEQLNYNMVYSGKSRFPFNEIVGYRKQDVMDKEIANYTYYKKYESDYSRPIEIPQYFKMTSEMKYFKEKKVWPKMDEKALETILATKDIADIDTEFIIANRPTLFHIYMRECASGFIKDKFLDKNPKLQWLEDFIEGNEGRFIVFTNFINETKIISELCGKKKRHWCIYDGDHKDLSHWEKYEDCVGIVNVVAGGAGLNDFAITNIGIYFSLPENHIDFEQSKGRIDRIGQTKQPVYYYLMMSGGVEPQIYNSLKEGKDFDARMFDQWLDTDAKKMKGELYEIF